EMGRRGSRLAGPTSSQSSPTCGRVSGTPAMDEEPFVFGKSSTTHRCSDSSRAMLVHGRPAPSSPSKGNAMGVPGRPAIDQEAMKLGHGEKSWRSGVEPEVSAPRRHPLGRCSDYHWKDRVDVVG